MYILLFICLFLVMLSLIMTLVAMARLEVLRKQNDLLERQLQQLLGDYQHLQAQVEAVPESRTPAQQAELAPVMSADANPEQNPVLVLRQQLRRVQEVLGHYAERHQGQYPANLGTLVQFANRQNLQQVVANPYTGARNPLISEDVCLDITHDPADEGLSEQAGKLLYQAQLDEAGRAHSYTLAAFDQAGLLLKEDNGEVITLNPDN